MRDFFTFRRMLTPLLIQIIYWLGTAACILAGIVTLVTGHDFVRGLITLIIGPIIVRIICELVILFFRINETLTDIRNELRRGTLNLGGKHESSTQ